MCIHGKCFQSAVWHRQPYFIEKMKQRIAWKWILYYSWHDGVEILGSRRHRVNKETCVLPPRWHSRSLAGTRLVLLHPLSTNYTLGTSMVVSETLSFRVVAFFTLESNLGRKCRERAIGQAAGVRLSQLWPLALAPHFGNNDYVTLRSLAALCMCVRRVSLGPWATSVL